MKTYKNRLITTVFGGAALFLVSGCTKEAPKITKGPPVTKLKQPGDSFETLTLTAKAIERIDIKTGKVEKRDQAPMVVPYSALIYNPQGETFVFESREDRKFVRVPVTVEKVVGNDVMLAKGPAAGTEIATVGVAELYGSEGKGK